MFQHHIQQRLLLHVCIGTQLVVDRVAEQQQLTALLQIDLIHVLELVPVQAHLLIPTVGAQDQV